MKKLLIIIIILLVGCSENEFKGDIKTFEYEKIIIESNLSEKILSKGYFTYDEVIRHLGRADEFYYGERYFDPLKLPDLFIAKYNEGMSLLVYNDVVKEVTITSEVYDLNNLFTIGVSEDTIRDYYNDITIKKNTWNYKLRDVFYVNYINELHLNLSYYHNSKDDIEFRFVDNVLSSITYNISEVFEDAYEPRLRGYSSVVSTPFLYAYEDKLNVKFIDDVKLIGKWRYLDCVYDLNDFSIGERQSNHEFIDLQFLNYGMIKNSYYGWTKGKLISSLDSSSDVLNYYFTSIMGSEHLVLEDSTSNHIYIFRREE